MRNIEKFHIKPKTDNDSMSLDSEHNHYTNEVKQWLYDIKLDRYLNNFISNGFENMTFIADTIDDEVLQQIGIKLLAHRKVILVNIKKLNSAKNSKSLSPTPLNDTLSASPRAINSSLDASDTFSSDHAESNKHSISYSQGNSLNPSSANDHMYDSMLTVAMENDYDIQNEIIFEDIDEEKEEKNQQNIYHIKFKEWLKNKVRLEQYLSLFCESSLNDTRKINVFTDEKLKRIGIENVLHRKRIVHEAGIYGELQCAFSKFIENNEILSTYKSQFQFHGILTQRELQNSVQNMEDLALILQIKQNKVKYHVWQIMEPCFQSHIYSHKHEYYENECNDIIRKLVNGSKLYVAPASQVKAYETEFNQQKHLTFCSILPNTITMPHSSWEFKFYLYIPYTSKRNRTQLYVYAGFDASYATLKTLDGIITKNMSNGSKYFACSKHKFPSRMFINYNMYTMFLR